MERIVIALRELAEEIGAMLEVCFEGKIIRENERLTLFFPNGQRFAFELREVT